MSLTDEDREALLVPCSCGHTLNEHGSLLACWACDEDGDDCATNFEALLAERTEAIVARHVEAALNAAADEVKAAADQELDRKPEPCGHEDDGFCHSSAAFTALDRAARIIRAARTNT